ncbi:DUF4282 domain-containing protein [Pontimonas sp.]|uniref:DUF4282 domain-containing protein n=2 Tax=Pontimonas sp. TaxID=2304492 RepID=UPI0028708F19|nr:DUF4282 domain-containing protein [Pontimonas sp.]MDR9396617.1 DUF4282 domain-containing protein [Pontimonas sp.]
MTDSSGMTGAPVQQKGFFAALFDLKFEEWVTLRVAGVLYVIILALLGLFGVVAFFSLLLDGGLSILFALVGVPLVLFIAVLLIRLSFEATVALIAVARNTESLKDTK